MKAKLGDARKETLKASMLNFAERAFRPLPFELLTPKFLPFLKVAAPTIANAQGRPLPGGGEEAVIAETHFGQDLTANIAQRANEA